MDRLSKKIDNGLNNDKESAILSEVEEINDKLEEGVAKEETVEQIEESIGKIFKGIALIKGEPGNQGEPGKEADEDLIVDKVLERIPPAENGKTPIKGKDYLTNKELELIKTEVTPVKGEDYFTNKEIKGIVDKLKKLVTPKKGKDYLTDKELKAIKKAVTPKKGVDYSDGYSYRDIPVGGGAGSQGSTDLSSQCDGLNMVFTLDGKYRGGTVKLHSSQAPLIYRPTVDFTESGTLQITLTSEVDPPETGQTLMAFYEKP